jgi:membrane fusion protein (multidrug efflux system)
MTITRRIVLMIVVPLCAIAAGMLWYALKARFVETDNAYIRSDTTTISSDIDGRVVSVEVRDNSHVEKGQLLFTLDPRPFHIQLKRAMAKLDTVRFELDSIRAEYREYIALISEAEERVAYLNREMGRQQDLADKGVGTGAQLDEAIHEWERALKDLRIANERSRKALAGLGGNAEVSAEEHPMYIEAVSVVDEAKLMLEYTSIVAPASGVVSRMNLEPGEWVEEGRSVFYLVGSTGLWIEANLKETQMTKVRVGQSVAAIVDAFPDQPLNGEVTRISPATGSEFMVLPPQNATGNWIKVVQRIPVRIEFEDVEKPLSLRAGMTVRISIDTVHEGGFLTAVRESATSLLPN